MYTLDQMCCLCNKNDKPLVNVNDIDKNVVKKYIDKFLFVFPDLLVLDDIEKKHIKFFCTGCNNFLKQIYIFKLQCKNTLLIREAYFNNNFPDDVEFKFGATFIKKDPDVFVTDSYQISPLPFEIDFKIPEDEIVESNIIPTVPLPFDIYFKEPEDQFNAVVQSNNINVEAPIVSNNINFETTAVLNNIEAPVVSNNNETSEVSNNIAAPVVSNHIDVSVVSNNIKAPVVLNNNKVLLVSNNVESSVVPNNIHFETTVISNNIDASVVSNNIDTPIVSNNIKGLVVSKNIDASVDPNNIHFQTTVVSNNIDASGVSNNINIETSVANNTAAIGLCSVPEEISEELLNIEPDNSEESHQDSVSVVQKSIRQRNKRNAVERVYPDPSVGSCRDSYYPGKLRPRTIKQFTVPRDEPVITNGGKIIETSTYFADHDAKIFMCKRCNKQYTTARTLSMHMIRHTGEKDYKCPFCKKKNFTLSEHNSHVVLHTSDHPYECKICGKKFKETVRLKMHMNSHTRERKFICDFCGKDFHYQSNLISHKSLHSKEKKYSCKICTKSFRLLSSLKVHVDAHNNKIFQCDSKNCSKMFLTNAGYYRHKIQHNQPPSLKCDYCKKEFYFKSVLNVHLKTHKKEKPFVCKLCNNSFKTNSSLKVHSFTHTGDKPHRCEECGRCFRQTGTLTVHMRTHNGDRPYQCQVCPNKGFIKSHHYENHVKKVHGAHVVATGSKKSRRKNTRAKSPASIQNKDRLDPKLQLPLNISPGIEQIVNKSEDKIEENRKIDDTKAPEEMDIEEDELVIDLEAQIEQKTYITPLTESSKNIAPPVLQALKESISIAEIPTEARKTVVPIEIVSSEIITSAKQVTMEVVPIEARETVVPTEIVSTKVIT